MSTAPDMMRFANALANGTIVPEKYANQFRGIGVAGGGPGVNATLELGIAGEHSVIVLSNFDPPNASKISRQISDLLRQAADADSGVKRYRLGVGLAPHDEGVEVGNVEPDSPAEKGGLEPGDIILAINGARIADDPISHFDAVLIKPDPIKMKVRRGSEVITITIIPEPR